MTLFGKRISGLALALLVSLCVNAFALAAVGSHWLRDGPPPRRGEGRDLERFVQGAPEGVRPMMRSNLENNRAELEKRFGALREARGHVHQLLRSPNFDPGALDQAFATMRQRQSAVQEVLHGAMAQAAGMAPPEARAAWAERWDRRP